jgi:DNA-binding XRE family transcriptional regulator
MKRRKTSNALELIAKDSGHDPQHRRRVERGMVYAEMAQAIYDARNEAGLTQQKLADLVGTTQSAIARLEDADYDGHSLSMVQRIAKALGRRVEVKLIPVKRMAKRTSASALKPAPR